jgi:hypothetical protein
MAQPMTAIMTNMLRSMFMKRRKIAASKPAIRMKSFSLVCHNGGIQDHGPLPSGGGARDSSACFNLGAYTTVWYGRKNENNRTTAAVTPSDEAKEAQTDLVASYGRTLISIRIPRPDLVNE